MKNTSPNSPRPKRRPSRVDREHRPNRKRTRRAPKGHVRLPKDYPWVVMGRLVDDLSEHAFPYDIKRLRPLIRAKDVDGLMVLSDSWGLQSMPPVVDSPNLEKIKCRLMFGALLRKFPFEGREQVRRDKALSLLRESETLCAAFNTRNWLRLTDGRRGGTPSRFLTVAREFCSRVLGDLDLDRITLCSRHGPGSSSSTSKGKTDAFYKYQSWPYHVTPRAVSHIKRLILSDERWRGALEESYRLKFHIDPWKILHWPTFWDNVLEIVDHNRVTTVPKDYRKDRTIAIEPTANMMLQLGVDGHIRKRLKRWGIDLDYQTKNQLLAKRGSEDISNLSPSTIDLASASDLVSLRILKLFLPEDWYVYLCDLRSPYGELPDGTRLRFSKFASMGNGATFVIESLIFAAITYSTSLQVYGYYQRDLISIFGDDIICPTGMSRHLVDNLEMCGFMLNLEKSFLKGPIKESCGKDWIHGRMVRPVFLKKIPTNCSDLFVHRNLLFRWASQHLGVELSRTESLYQKWIPESFRFWGPISDLEFASYLHTSERPSLVGWKYVGKSFALSAIPQRCNKISDFNFRKLKATLRSTRQTTWKDLFLRVVASSSFDVTARGRQRLRVVPRVFPYWVCEYSPPEHIARGVTPWASLSVD